jgi:hypothetical protein
MTISQLIIVTISKYIVFLALNTCHLLMVLQKVLCPRITLYINTGNCTSKNSNTIQPQAAT